MNDKSKASPTWLKPVADYGPLVLFLAAYLLLGLMAATAVIVAASLVALALTWLYERRVPLMPLVTAGVVSVFGGLTLWLQDETFIKMKPTIVQLIFAVVLLGGLAFGRSPLKALFGKAMSPMTDAGWRGLTLRYSLFFVGMAVLNECVWRTQSTDLWVSFKVLGLPALTIVFFMAQIPLMKRHMLETEDAGSTGGSDA